MHTTFLFYVLLLASITLFPPMYRIGFTFFIDQEKGEKKIGFAFFKRIYISNWLVGQA